MIFNRFNHTPFNRTGVYIGWLKEGLKTQVWSAITDETTSWTDVEDSDTSWLTDDLEDTIWTEVDEASISF